MVIQLFVRGDGRAQLPHVPHFQRVVCASSEQHGAVGRRGHASAGFWNLEPRGLGRGDEGGGGLVSEANDCLWSVVGAAAAPELQGAVVAYGGD